MEPRFNTVLDASGTPIGGATVTVFESDGVTPATIFDLAGSPQANPFTTNLEGEYSYQAANGRYVERSSFGGTTEDVPVVLFDPADQAGTNDQQVRITSSDTTSDFLDNKLVVTGGVTKTILNPAGNESIQLSLDTAIYPKVSVSSNDTTIGFLAEKLVAGSNITLVEQNDGSAETLQINSASLAQLPTSTGNNTAYEIEDGGPSTFTDNEVHFFIAHVDSAVGPVIRVNQGGAGVFQALETQDSNTIAAGAIKANRAYAIRYNQTSDEWRVINFANSELSGFTSGGGAGPVSAYTLTSQEDQVLIDGQTVAMIAHAANAADATLNYNSTGIKNITLNNGSNVVANDMLANGIYLLGYEASSDKWRLLNPEIGASLSVAGDTGSEAINLETETLTIAGGTGITTSAASNTVTVSIEDPLTLSGLGVGEAHNSNYSLNVVGGAAGQGANISRVTIGRSNGDYGGIGENLRFTATSNTWNYNVSDFAALIRFTSGGVEFLTAPSGTAGNAVTLTQRMLLTEPGVLTVGGDAVVLADATQSLSNKTLNSPAINTSATIIGASPQLFFNESDATADNGLWSILAESEGLRFRAIDDGFVSPQEFLVVDRTASTIDTVSFLNGTVTITTADINGGAIDGVTLGTNSAITEAQIDNININGDTIQNLSNPITLLAAGDLIADPSTGILKITGTANDVTNTAYLRIVQADDTLLGAIGISNSVTNDIWVQSQTNNVRLIASSGNVYVGSSGTDRVLTTADEGTLNAGTLDSLDSTQFIRSDADDTMTSVLTMSAVQPRIRYAETDATANNRNWEIEVQGEQFRIKVGADDYSTTQNFIEVNRTDVSIDEVVFPNGNVGIGAAVVDQMLHVERASGTALIKVEVGANSRVGFEIQRSGGTLAQWRILDGEAGNGTLTIRDETNSRNIVNIAAGGDLTLNPAGTISFNSNSTISTGTPTLTLQDSDSTGNAIVANVIFQDSGSTQRAFCGYGSASDSDWTVQNTLGDIVLDASGGNTVVSGTAPVLVIRDTDSTGSAQFGSISFRNSASSQTAAVGFNSAINTDFTIQNTLGDVVLDPSATVRITAPTLMITDTTAEIELRETGATANNERWILTATGEQFLGRIVNDAGSVVTNFLTVDRTTTVVDTIGLLAGTVQVKRTSIGAAVGLEVENEATSSNSSALIRATVNPPSSGDVIYVAELSGTAQYSWGIDNSDNDTFKITAGSANGIGSDVYITIRSSSAAQGIAFFDSSTGQSFGSGDKVIFISNADSVPSANPSGGGIFYVEAGALKYRGSSGTVTTIANA